MKKKEKQAICEVKARLIEVAGRTTQDLGLGRIVGQVLCFVYLTDQECSLDEIGKELELSKAAVSIAARQLESLGLLQRVWKKGDRKNYYRMVGNFGKALQQGALSMIRAKVQTIGSELDDAEQLLQHAENGQKNPETRFLRSRLDRAKRLRNRAIQIMDNPIIKLLGR